MHETEGRVYTCLYDMYGVTDTTYVYVTTLYFAKKFFLSKKVTFSSSLCNKILRVTKLGELIKLHRSIYSDSFILSSASGFRIYMCEATKKRAMSGYIRRIVLYTSYK